MSCQSGQQQGPSLWERLAAQPYCLLTTFRRDGTPVPTPMWFAVQDETLYFYTRGQSGKVKRLRRDPRVTVGPCDSSGRLKGPTWEGVARLLEPDSEEVRRANALLAERYGLKRRLLLWGMSFSKDKSSALIAVRLTES